MPEVITLRVRSLVPFCAGIVVAVFTAAIFVGIRASAATSASGDATFVPVAPCRLFDFRPGTDNVGPRTSALGPGETYRQQVTGTVGNCSVPATASAVAMNVTVVGGTAPSFLTLFPDDVAKPTASALNWVANSPPTPNKVDVKLSGTGGVSLFNSNGTVFVLADVTGYYTSAGLDALRDVSMTIDGKSAQLDGSNAQFSTQNSCTSSYNGSLIIVPLPIPVGASIVAVSLQSYDEFGVGTYSFSLQRRSVGTHGADVATIAPAVTLGAAAGVTVTTDLTPTIPDIVEPGEMFELRFDDGNNGAAGFGNGAICAVNVSYRLPSA